MKNYILFIAFIAFIFSSCDKKAEYENEMSAVVDVAGEWFVTYDHDVYGADPFGAGHTAIVTYNTADNASDEMWVSDLGNFWWYTVKVPVNLDTKTFGSTDTIVSVYPDYAIKCLVENGQIFEGTVTHLPSGAVTDSIYFEIYFEDLAGATGIDGDRLIVSGYRRTGFLEDEPH